MFQTGMRILVNLGLSILVISIAASAFLVDRLLEVGLPRTLSWLGWPFIVAGTGLLLWAVVVLAREGGATGAPTDPTKTLVDSGPYAWLRNPIYAGDGVLIFGLALLTGSPTLLLYDLLFLLAIDQYLRRVEEPGLQRRFGEDYAVYSRAVPRWLARISGARREDG
jgi:protein-S-isoprenylcysteine O-methyltransferase Ste14